MTKGSAVRTGIVGALLAFVVAGAAGCGSDDGSSTSATSATPSTTTAASGGSLKDIEAKWQFGEPTSKICDGRTYTIGIDYYGASFPYGRDISRGMNDAAKQIGCVKTTILSDNIKPEQVISNVQSLIRQKPDGVIMNSAIDATAPTVAKLLSKADIPSVTTSVGTAGVPWLQPNAHKAGLQGGAGVAELYKKRFGSKEPYVILGDQPALVGTADERLGGAMESLQKALGTIPKDHQISFDSKSDPAVSATQTTGALSTIPKGAPIIALGFSDHEAGYPMLKTIKSKGRDVIGLGFGGDSAALPFVCGGDYVSVALHPEDHYKWLIPALMATINGEKLPDKIDLPSTAITKDNLATEYPNVTC